MSFPQLSFYEPLYWLLAVLVLVAGFYLSLVRRPLFLKWISFLLRVLGVVLLVLAMCFPEIARHSNNMHFNYLVDVSESVDLDDSLKALEEIDKENQKLDGSDTSSSYLFASAPRAGTTEEQQKLLGKWVKSFGESNYRSESAISKAISNSRLYFPQGKGKTLVVYTDGRSTEGDVEQSLASLKADNVRVVFKKLSGINKPEAGVSSLIPSRSSLHVGEKFILTAHVFSSLNQKTQVQFLSRGVILKKMVVDLKPGTDNIFTYEVTADSPGVSEWQAAIVPQQDHFLNNNQAVCTIDAKGMMKVLAIHEKPQDLRHFRRSLAKQKIELEARGPLGMPRTLDGLLEFDAIILANVAATKIGSRVMENVRRYVVDFGGGLIMTGSDNSFGLGGYYRTPLESVLPMTSRYEKEKETPSLAVGLVIDKSGSMGGDKIMMARAAAVASVELLGQRDYASVVAFDGNAYNVVELTSATRKQDIIAGIESIAAGGGTNMYPGMQASYEALRNSSSKAKHMIILGDGQSSPGPFIELASDAQNAGITISTIALGQGADGQVLKAIAEAGGGRFYATFNPEDVPAIFAKETVEASRSAIKEDPFMPVSVPGQTFLDGIDLSEAPFLLGFVMTRFKPTAQPVLATETGEPLMAFGRYGIGKSVAFSSGVGEKWAGEWLDWQYFGKFWAQTLRAVARSGSPSGTSIRIENNEDSTTITLLRDRENNPGDRVEDWGGVISLKNGQKMDIVLKPEGIGCYRWKGNIGQASFNVSAFEKNLGLSVQKSVRQSYKKEYALVKKADKAILQRGFSSRDTAPPRSDSVWKWYSLRGWAIASALLLFMLGIFLRRI